MKIEEAIVLKARVRDLYEEYGACLDAQEFNRWPDFFTENCVYQVQSAENYEQGLLHADIYCDGRGMVLDRVSATGVLVYEPRRQRRFFSNLLIHESGDVIRSSAAFMLTEAMIDRDPILALTGRYIDEIVSENGKLVFRQRLCIYDNYRIVQNLIFPL